MKRTLIIVLTAILFIAVYFIGVYKSHSGIMNWKSFKIKTIPFLLIIITYSFLLYGILKKIR
ncbi:hypothetical protein [uncultured Tenacibaculum sp.]|uniref:hypothetical protein n=1 Tax=uncultured Tenacibaculum sp. TaxID=174713 RepID=UPI00261745B8|nr:hypothetical protein [uncultured Tenacibaculum sp.]